MSEDTENIYRSIGVEPIINCRGTFTIIGGSIERPEVLAAMEQAAGNFVQYDELAAGVGQRLQSGGETGCGAHYLGAGAACCGHRKTTRRTNV